MHEGDDLEVTFAVQAARRRRHDRHGLRAVPSGPRPDQARHRRRVAVAGAQADIDRPPRYEQQADDVAALTERLGIEQADLFGFSPGETADGRE